MNNPLLLILFWVLASCGMPVSDFSQGRPVVIISAEKTDWSGGQAGVKGTMYTVKLKKKDNVIIKSLMAEGKIIPFSQNSSGNIVTIKGNLQHPNNREATIEDLPAGASVESSGKNINSKGSWLEYTLKDTNISHKVSISGFISVETHEEPAP